MLGTLENEQKGDWKRYVNSLVYAYNCTPQSWMKHSPFEIMFGRKPKLPIDSLFEQVTENTTRTTKQYINDLKQRMETTRKIVQKHLETSKARQKNYYDLKAKAAKLETGDRVLVKILAFEGKHKIQDRFEDDVYIVTDQPNDQIPVYKVRSETTPSTKTLHRNHLFPIGEGKPLPKRRLSLEKNKKTVATKKRRRVKSEVKDQSNGYVTRDQTDSSEGSDTDESRRETGIRFVNNTNLYGDAYAPEEKEEDEERRDEEMRENSSRNGQSSDSSDRSQKMQQEDKERERLEEDQAAATRTRSEEESIVQERGQNQTQDPIEDSQSEVHRYESENEEQRETLERNKEYSKEKDWHQFQSPEYLLGRENSLHGLSHII